MPTLVIARVFSNALFTIEVQSLPASAALTSLLVGNHVERMCACMYICLQGLLKLLVQSLPGLVPLVLAGNPDEPYGNAC